MRILHHFQGTAIDSTVWPPPLNTCGGGGSLPAARVLEPTLRVQGSSPATDDSAVLLIDDPGVPDALLLRQWLQGGRRTRVQTSAGERVINPLVHHRTSAITDEGLPMYIDVELAALGGDLAPFNGVQRYQQAAPAPPPFQGDYGTFHTLFYPMHPPFPGVLDMPFVRMRWYGVPDPLAAAWQVIVATHNIRVPFPPEVGVPCWKEFRRIGGGTAYDDAEGLYPHHTCTDTACVDPTTCALSSGATCRVRWAGATWV